jgi:hypothetical protein
MEPYYVSYHAYFIIISSEDQMSVHKNYEHYEHWKSAQSQPVLSLKSDQKSTPGVNSKEA